MYADAPQFYHFITTAAMILHLTFSGRGAASLILYLTYYSKVLVAGPALAFPATNNARPGSSKVLSFVYLDNFTAPSRDLCIDRSRRISAHALKIETLFVVA